MAVYTINAHVSGQEITLELGDVKLVAGSENIYQLQFDYTDEWTAFTKKAVFMTSYPKVSIIEVLISGTNIITIPERTLAYEAYLNIGVYGVGDDSRIPTVWSEKVPIYEGTKQGYPAPPAPDPDVYAEILAAMAGKQDILTWDETPTAGSNNPVKSKGIKAALDTKADTDGIYPSLVAGSSEQMLSENYTVDKAPYLFRALPFKSNRVRESIVGGSVAWNQLCNYASATTDTVNNVTFTNNNDGSFTVNGTNSQATDAVFNVSTVLDALIPLHKYLVSSNVKNANVGTCLANYAASSKSGANGAAIFECPANSTYGKVLTRLYVSGSATVDNVKVIPQVTDLTLMFGGTTIADYVYNLEQQTQGSGIAWLKSYGFFKDPYNAFDAGSIQSVSTDKKKVVGWNQWDEQWEVGGLNTTTGADATMTDRIRSKNYIPVLPNTGYYFKAGVAGQTAWQLTCCCYDADKNFIGTVFYKRNDGYTIPDNCYYIRFMTTSGYGTSYINNICINLYDSSKNGQYQPYQSTTYTLDHDSLNGLPKLDANNKLYYDGDTYESDGTVTRKYRLVALAEQAWNYSTTLVSGLGIFYTSGFGERAYGGMNLLTPKYAAVGARGNLANADKTISQYNSTSYNICIRDDAYTNATTFANSLTGQYLLVENATPVTETSTPFPSIENIYANGTEEFTDYAVAQGTRDVSIPVGHESEYLEDSQAKLDGLPWNFANLIAPTEATYTATRNYASGDYLIVNNTLYKVTSAIANGGTITVGTNVTATTLTAEILAL